MSIKQWLTRFGLKEAKSGECAVQLDMPVYLEAAQPKSSNEEEKSQMSIAEGEEGTAEAEAPKNPWAEKSKVLEVVLNKVDRVMAYRQREYNALRDQVRTDLEEQERIKAEEE